jgi:hypothetical protein
VPANRSHGTSAGEGCGRFPRGRDTWPMPGSQGRAAALARRLSIRVALPPLPIRYQESVLDQEVLLLSVHGVRWGREPPSSGSGDVRQVDVEAAVECNAHG